MKKQNQEKELTFGNVARMFSKLQEQGYSVEEIMTMPIYVK